MHAAAPLTPSGQLPLGGRWKDGGAGAGPAGPAADALRVPCVDLSRARLASREGREAAAAEVLRACERVGFFYAGGRAEESRLSGQLIERSREFFALPAAEKERVRMSGRAGAGARGAFVPRGYFGVGEERLINHEDDGGIAAPAAAGGARALRSSSEGGGDLKEGLDIGASRAPTEVEEATRWPGAAGWPSGAARFREVAERYSESMLALARALMEVFGIALGAPGRRGVFLENSETPVATLRILHYPGRPGGGGAPAGEDLACGAHSDYGLCTILCDGGVPGLQVLSPASSEWIDVAPVPGTFVINTGAMMHRWTSGKFRNTIHRVRHVPSVRGRISVPFFFNPSPSAVIRPISPHGGGGDAPAAETCAEILARRYVASGLAGARAAGPNGRE